MAANVNTCAVVCFCKEHLNPVIFEWNWGEDDLPIADQHTYLGAKISQYCSWASQITKVLKNGKSQVEEIAAVLADSHLDTRITIYTLIHVIVPRRDMQQTYDRRTRSA